MHMYRKAHETRMRGALLHDLLRIKERARRTQDARTAVVKYSGRARPTRTLYIRNRQQLHSPPSPVQVRAPCAEVCRTALAGGRSGLPDAALPAQRSANRKPGRQLVERHGARRRGRLAGRAALRPGRAGAGRADAARQKARDRARRPPDDARSLVLSRLISRFLGIVCSLLRYHRWG
jgi:hypothetical protein